MGLHYRNKKRICAEKEKGISIVKRRKKKDTQVHSRAIKKEVYQIL